MKGVESGIRTDNEGGVLRPRELFCGDQGFEEAVFNEESNRKPERPGNAGANQVQ